MVPPVLTILSLPHTVLSATVGSRDGIVPLAAVEDVAVVV